MVKSPNKNLNIFYAHLQLAMHDRYRLMLTIDHKTFSFHQIKNTFKYVNSKVFVRSKLVVLPQFSITLYFSFFFFFISFMYIGDVIIIKMFYCFLFHLKWLYFFWEKENLTWRRILNWHWIKSYMKNKKCNFCIY